MVLLWIDKNNRVIGRHYNYEKLDNLDGGILVDNIPSEPQEIINKIAVLYCNPITKEMKYEYEEIQKSNEEIEKEIFAKTLSELTIENKKKDVMITQLAETVADLTVKVNSLKGGI
ncbi:MAG: hypothetical protein RR486_09090 [Clostridium sp.]|uniref:hypothetical protein n=1 Tax=Clostridium sp. TaxID=1506 RepID=UPI0030625A9A